MAQDSLQLKIKTAIDTAEAAKGVADLRRSMKELKGLAMETSDTNSAAFQQITAAIGAANDRMADLNAVIKSQSGEPIENLRNSILGMGGSLKSLDFKSFKQQFGAMGSSIKDLTSGFTGGFNVVGNFNKAITAGKGPIKAATSSFWDLAKSIMATGLGALAIALVMVITNIEKLSEAGGLLGKVFTMIGDTIGWVMDLLTEFSDKIGFTDIKNQERSKNAIKAAQNEREHITSRYDAEIKKAEAAGKSVDELNKKKNTALAYSINQEIMQYENLKKSKGKLNEDEQKELAALYKSRNDLVLENQLIDIKAEKEKTDKANEEAKKRKEEQDRINQKKKQEADKYEKDLADLKTKYILDERQQLEKKFTDDLNKIKGNSEAETKLRLEIEADRTKALTEYDDKVKKDKEDKETAAKEKEKQKKQEAFDLRKKELEDERLLLEGDLVAQRDFLDAHYEELGMTDNEYFVARAKLEEDITAKEKEELNKRLDEEKKARDDKFKVAQDFVSGLSALGDLVSTIEMAGLKEGTKAYDDAARRKFNINKALQLSSATITGIQSVMDAYANGIKNPVPLLGPATATAYAIMAGVAAAANIAKIAATQYKSSASPATTGGGGGGGGGLPDISSKFAGGGAAPQMSAAQMLGIGTTGLTSPSQTPWQKVYVSEGDIRNVTGKVEVIENRSKLGA